MPGAPSRLAAILAMLATLAVAPVLAGCGAEEEEHEVVEGDPLELGELRYNVQLTRFVNPNDVEDAEYLIGQPPASPSTSYLGVFLTITSESDDRALASASEYVVTDIRGDRYEPLDSESPYALEVGASVPPGGQLPPLGSTAAAGPAAGALLVFLVDDAVIDSRPITLEIDSEAGSGEVELDI